MIKIEKATRIVRKREKKKTKENKRTGDLYSISFMNAIPGILILHSRLNRHPSRVIITRKRRRAGNGNQTKQITFRFCTSHRHMLHPPHLKAHMTYKINFLTNKYIINPLKSLLPFFHKPKKKKKKFG